MVVLELNESIRVTGEPDAVALYTFCLLRAMKMQGDHDAEEVAKKEIELLGKFGSMTIEELIKRESNDEDE